MARLRRSTDNDDARLRRYDWTDPFGVRGTLRDGQPALDVLNPDEPVPDEDDLRLGWRVHGPDVLAEALTQGELPWAHWRFDVGVSVEEADRKVAEQRERAADCRRRKWPEYGNTTHHPIEE